MTKMLERRNISPFVIYCAHYGIAVHRNSPTPRPHPTIGHAYDTEPLSSPQATTYAFNLQGLHHRHHHFPRVSASWAIPYTAPGLGRSGQPYMGPYPNRSVFPKLLHLRFTFAYYTDGASFFCSLYPNLRNLNASPCLLSSFELLPLQYLTRMTAFTAPNWTSQCLHRRQIRHSTCRSTHHICYAAADPLLLRVARGEGPPRSRFDTEMCREIPLLD